MTTTSDDHAAREAERKLRGQLGQEIRQYIRKNERWLNKSAKYELFQAVGIVEGMEMAPQSERGGAQPEGEQQ